MEKLMRIKDGIKLSLNSTLGHQNRVNGRYYNHVMTAKLRVNRDKDPI